GEDLHLELLEALRERSCRVREMRRCADVGRSIAEVAREVSAVRDRGADLDTAARGGRVRARRQADAEPRELRRRIPAALELVEAIELRARGLDALTRGSFGVKRVDAVREVAQRLARAARAQRRHGGRQRGRETPRVELRVLTAADEQPAARGALGAVQER